MVTEWLFFVALVFLFALDSWRRERERTQQQKIVELLMAQLESESKLKHQLVRALQNRINAGDIPAYSALQAIDQQGDVHGPRHRSRDDKTMAENARERGGLPARAPNVF